MRPAYMVEYIAFQHSQTRYSWQAITSTEARLFRRIAIIALAAYVSPAAALLAGSAAAQAQEVTVFAAASLKNALDEIAAAWKQAQGKQTRIAYGASPALARQIEAAAPADIFLSADPDWMDYVDQRKLLRPASRANLLANRIVLIAPKDSSIDLKIEKGFALRAALAGGRLAMANTDSVPAGKYGKAALEALGVWSTVQDRVAQAENVRAALLLVSRGEAAAGIVYQTDAAADSNVRIIGTFPQDTHSPIVYPIAILQSSKNPDAAAFVAFLKTPTAARLFEKQGFSLVK
jgi:molybdate transport system substrate-binding protein